jgi:hypothetical protein
MAARGLKDVHGVHGAGVEPVVAAPAVPKAAEPGGGAPEE